MKNSTKKRIIEKARDLLFTMTEDDITMIMIGTELDITAPTLYHYFKSKEEILEAGNHLIADEILQMVTINFPPSIPYEMRIITATTMITDYFMENELPAACLIEDPVDRPLSLKKVRDHFTGMFTEYKKKKKSAPKISAELMAYRFLSLVVADIVFIRSSKKEMPADFAERVWESVGY